MDVSTFERVSEIGFRCNKPTRISVRLNMMDALMLQTLCSETEMSTTEIVGCGIRALFGIHKSLADNDPGEDTTGEDCPD
jgi:hypothetical protein